MTFPPLPVCRSHKNTFEPSWTRRAKSIFNRRGRRTSEYIFHDLEVLGGAGHIYLPSICLFVKGLNYETPF